MRMAAQLVARGQWFGGGAKAYVCAKSEDMRKSIDGLVPLLAPLLRGDGLYLYSSRAGE